MRRGTGISALAIGAIPLLSFALTVTAPRAAPITSADFLERLQEARQLAEAGALNPSPGAMDAVRARLGLPVQLLLPAGTVRIEAVPFLDRLRGEVPQDFDRAAQHLAAFSASVGSADSTSATDRAAVASALDRAYEGIATPGWLQRLGRNVREALARLLQALVEPLFRYRGFGSLIAWSVVLGVAVIMLLVLRRLGVNLVPERSGSSADPTFVATDWHRLAEQAIRRGDLREAIRALFHALVVTLASRGVIAADPGVTAGECRSAVARAMPALYPSVAEATKAFERVAYGGAPAGQGEVDALRTANREATS
ncbi:MAG TPA: DUF4129 domain-containing protein [Actinomycetota bacterium]|nr:DUF4129 domain-containing protein [Actinomycetota bacterium]